MCEYVHGCHLYCGFGTLRDRLLKHLRRSTMLSADTCELEIPATLAVGRQATDEGDIAKNIASIPVGQLLRFTFSEDSVDVKCLDLIRSEKETLSKLFQNSICRGSDIHATS